jgi:hypothetical protein
MSSQKLKACASNRIRFIVLPLVFDSPAFVVNPVNTSAPFLRL